MQSGESWLKNGKGRSREYQEKRYISADFVAGRGGALRFLLLGIVLQCWNWTYTVVDTELPPREPESLFGGGAISSVQSLRFQRTNKVHWEKNPPNQFEFMEKESDGMMEEEKEK